MGEKKNEGKKKPASRKKKDADDSLAVSLKGNLLKGNVETAVKVGSFTQFFRNLFPGFTAQGRIKHAMVDNIERQFAKGKSVADLSKAEQLLIANANLSELRKAVNKQAILERAEQIEPKLFEPPFVGVSDKALPPGPDAAERSAESKDEQQYFWERFWADAEVVSVPYFQAMYARILTGKVKSPGTFSLKTLDTVRCLDERTASLFNEVCQYAIGGYLVPAIFEPRRPFSVLELNLLADAGLLRADKLAIAIEPHSYSYDPWRIRIMTDSYLPRGIHPLTAAGRDLLSIIPVDHTDSRAIEVCRALSYAIKGESPCEVCKRPSDEWVNWRKHFGLEPNA
jgi:hypothetical protein